MRDAIIKARRVLAYRRSDDRPKRYNYKGDSWTCDVDLIMEDVDDILKATLNTGPDESIADCETTYEITAVDHTEVSGGREETSVTIKINNPRKQQGN